MPLDAKSHAHEQEAARGCCPQWGGTLRIVGERCPQWGCRFTADRGFSAWAPSALGRAICVGQPLPKVPGRIHPPRALPGGPQEGLCRGVAEELREGRDGSRWREQGGGPRASGGWRPDPPAGVGTLRPALTVPGRPASGARPPRRAPPGTPHCRAWTRPGCGHAGSPGAPRSACWRDL